MVRWYHLVLTAYGFWLPNDPRGSWSEFVRVWELRKFGPATTVSDGRNYAKDPHDRALRLEAKRALKFPVVRFDEAQRDAIADGFAVAIGEGGYLVHAGCIGHDHAHLIVARHDRAIEQVAKHLKTRATMTLTRAGVHPLRGYHRPDGSIPTPWAEGMWSVYIDDEEQLRCAIRYVERHPEKEGLRPQGWRFVTPVSL